MNCTVDDWHFRLTQPDRLVVDLYLLNGQHAMLEVRPLMDKVGHQSDIPEMIVTGEMPGEHGEGAHRRWISRPPNRECEWSHVIIEGALARQIEQKLSLLYAEA